MGSLEPVPPDCTHPGGWLTDNLPPSPAQVFCPWPHSRPGRWESDAKAHGPQPARSILTFPCSCPPRLAVRGSPSLGPGSRGVPHRGRATAGGAWTLQQAVAWLRNLPLPLLAVCLDKSSTSLGLDFLMQKLEMFTSATLPGLWRGDSCHSQLTVGI